MNLEMMLTFIILGITIVVFISDKFRVDVVAVLSLLALVLAGIIDTQQALAGFSNPTVIMIAGLFVVGAGLFRTGVADWLGDQLLSLAGNSETRLLVALMVGAALISGFLSNTGTVAVLLPAVVAAAWRIGSVPSKLLMPMAFAASMGGLLTLIGTPPNLVVNGALVSAGLERFGFFEFSLIGIPLLSVGVLYIASVGRRWLPLRQSDNYSSQPSGLVEDMIETYHLEENLCRLRVRRRSSLVNKTLEESELGQDYGIAIVSVERAPIENNGSRLPLGNAIESLTDSFGINQEDRAATIPGPETVIHADDVLLAEGTLQSIHRAAVRYNLGVQPLSETDEDPEKALFSRELGMAEILIAPRSALIGRTIIGANFSEKYNVRVLGIARRGKLVDDEPVKSVKLTFGDALLVRGTWEDIAVMENENRNFVVVGRPATMVRPTGLTPRAIIAILALIGMVIMFLTGVVSTVIAVIITAVIMILGGCLNMEQAYRAINWDSVILIAAMLPMATALSVTGGTEFIADLMVNTVGVLNPLFLMAAIFLLTTAFTQVISNSATAVLVAPIAIQAASELDVSAHPIMMMVAVGASAAFLTPIASPVNTLVMTPGGYRFGDFVRVGFPLMIIFLVVSLILVPLIWPL